MTVGRHDRMYAMTDSRPAPAPAASAPASRPGVVSVVLVNYQGAEDTITCLRSFADVDWPAERLELVVVDNDSGDGSAERIRAAVPTAVVVESPRNSGFAGGCNLGVAHSTGEYVGFINNDARPDAGWIRAAVELLEREPGVASVASKVLDWDGDLIDYVDGSLTWFGMGYKREVERATAAEYDVPRDVLFGTGAAMFVRASVFHAVGGFDERFFMFYEDVDLGWRLNLLGHRVRFEPGSLAFHRHHVTMRRFGVWREHYLLERNALFSLYKNYDDASLARALPAAMALAVRRGIERGGTDAHSLDLERGAGREGEAEMVVAKATMAPVFAVDAFLEQLPGLIEDRRKIQATRRRSDRDLLPLFRQPLEPALPMPRYLAGYQSLVEAFGIDEHFGTRRRIVVVTGEPLAERMAGPAIRAWEIAGALCVEHEVRLVSLGECSVTHPRFRCSSASGRDLRRLEAWCDVMIFQGLLLNIHPWLQGSSKILVVDVYDPFHLEALEQAKDLGEAGRETTVRDCTSALNVQLRRGDFFLCASTKQRDFWLGQLAALGRVNPSNYDEDETLESLIAVVPFGVVGTPPVHTRPAIKGVVDGIGPTDRVILWGGGIWNWFDPLTLLHAIDRLRHRRPDVRLFFLGVKHPNPGVPEMRMTLAARNLADSLGLTDRFVFFNEGWVPYDDRANYLLESDIGVSTHLDHVETAFSFRTRILDYIWAGLPVVATGGDTFGELLTREGLGITVPPGDVAALEEALFRLLDDEELAASCRDRLRAIAPQFAWTEALAPLVSFCRNPRRAPDLLAAFGDTSLAVRTPVTGGVDHSKRSDVRTDLALLRTYLREGGAAEAGRRASGRIRKRARQAVGLPPMGLR
jgi:GT2 family glycosyltransferase